MLDYIKGEVIELTPAFAVIEAGNLGYFIHISLNTYTSLSGTASGKLYIYEAIREDAHLLFGFADKRERELFLHLISVSGVGANTARMVLSSIPPVELEQIIVSGNSTALKSVKGIGGKTAERIIIDLKDKIKISGDVSSALTFDPVAEETAKEAISALTMLGFNQAASTKVVNKIRKDHPELRVEQIIKSALKML
ncbi:Holliday junction branch migration protein RuvA [Bacteroidales bacterium OttesenSCG-928-A17]|nr:Holliday junction branch migration protein RuvA [Bacteroidales bacterium OttesenSCG-928-A17]